MIFGLILLVIIISVVISCVKVVRQAQALVIERLGAYQATWGTGLHFKIPIFDRVARRVDLKEQVVDFAPQPVITKDNVTMRIDTVVFYQITDPKMFCYGVANPIMERRSTRRCVLPLMWQPIHGELRSTAWNLRTLSHRRLFRMQWRSR